MIKNYLIASRAYYHDHLTWCVQKAKPIPLWKNIFYICRNWDVYVVIFCGIMSLLLIVYYLYQFENPIRTWNEVLLIIFRCAIGMSGNARPQSTPLRVVYAFGLLGGILFSIVVSSVLMRNITTPIMRPQIQTIVEITNGDFKLIGDQFMLVKLKLQNKVKRLENSD